MKKWLLLTLLLLTSCEVAQVKPPADASTIPALSPYPADLSRPLGPEMVPWVKCLIAEGPLSSHCHSMTPFASPDSAISTATKPPAPASSTKP